jgi:thiol-disulfide isomerase/thioredoxin
MSEPRTASSPRPPRRHVYWIAAAIIAAVSLTAVVVAANSNPSSVSGKVDTSNLPDEGPVAELRAEGWLNSPPLTSASLTGKVVLYDFWTYSCINCIRTFPFIRSWYNRYKGDGLVVIGVHSPEFDFEKVHKNVEDAVERNDVTWPVAFDDDMKIWNAFANQYWPADYIADRSGHLRYKHFGEGDYDNTEDVIRTLLGVDPTSRRADEIASPETPSEVAVNPETYLDVAHRQLDVKLGTHDYPEPKAQTPPNVALSGRWTGANEHITAAATAATITLGVHAKSVNLVLATADGKPADAIVMLDGQPIPPDRRGAGVHVDGSGRTVVTVTAPDMYRLVAGPGVEDHQLAVVAEQRGLQAFAFTFG